MMATIAERSSLRRFDIDSRTNLTVFSRSVSLSALMTLWGSSSRMRSPRSPVETPPTAFNLAHVDLARGEQRPE
jgi:hypothetical protein